LFCRSLCGPLCTQQRKFIIFRLLFGPISITSNELREKHSNPFAVRNAGAVKFGIDRVLVGVYDF